MIVLNRKVKKRGGESTHTGEENTICIGDNIEVVLLQVKGKQVRLGVKAPKDVKINRKEIMDKQ